MVANDFYTNDIPSLDPSDSCLTALGWMTEFQIQHIAVVKEKKFLGVVGEDDIMSLADPSEPLSILQNSYTRSGVKPTEHIINVLKLLAHLHISIIPVVDEEDNYLGLVKLDDLLQTFVSQSAIKEPGGILVLDMNINDYAVSEIARIVESNNVKILCLFTRTKQDSTKLEVTLKLNRTNLRDVMSTFERFEYNIAGYYQEAGSSDYLKERYDLLLRYLNV